MNIIKLQCNEVKDTSISSLVGKLIIKMSYWKYYLSSSNSMLSSNINLHANKKVPRERTI